MARAPRMWVASEMSGHDCAKQYGRDLGKSRLGGEDEDRRNGDLSANLRRFLKNSACGRGRGEVNERGNMDRIVRGDRWWLSRGEK